MYKGIIFDVDGTAVELGATEADERLQESIRKAQGVMVLAAATGRSFGYARPIFTSLGLVSPSVIMGGSAILDPLTNEVIWGKAMDLSQSNSALDMVAGHQAVVNISTDPSRKNEQWDGKHTDKPIYTIWSEEMESADADQLAEAIATIPDVISHNTPSWNEGLVDVHITHAEATKEHAVRVLIEKLGLRPAEVIGVGDSDNDVPIFSVVGHKVAMDSGTEKLKAMADEIAPPLSEDGLAQIIDKYSGR